MAIAAVVTQSTVFGGAGGTTSSINTTGANFIAVAITYRQGGGVGLTDSKSNTWTQLTKYEGSGSQAGVVIYYCSSPTVGSGHTFTTTATFCGVNIIAASGVRTASTPFDQQNGQFISTETSSNTPGSITTSVADCLVITSVMDYNGAGTPTVPTGYTSIGTYTTATAFKGGAAYKILSGTSTENPSWGNITAGNNGACNIADFMPPAAAVTLRTFTLLGVGT